MLKLFASRGIDLRDAEGIAIRNGGSLDWRYVEDQLAPLAEASFRTLSSCLIISGSSLRSASGVGIDISLAALQEQHTVSKCECRRIGDAGIEPGEQFFDMTKFFSETREQSQVNIPRHSSLAPALYRDAADKQDSQRWPSQKSCNSLATPKRSMGSMDYRSFAK